MTDHSNKYLPKCLNKKCSVRSLIFCRVFPTQWRSKTSYFHRKLIIVINLFNLRLSLSQEIIRNQSSCPYCKFTLRVNFLSYVLFGQYRTRITQTKVRQTEPSCLLNQEILERRNSVDQQHCFVSSVK